MCNLYSVTSTQEAMRQLFKVERDNTGNLPSLPGIFPDQMAPVVRTAEDGVREMTMMRWGFPPPPKGNRPVTNVRNLKSSYWRPWLSKPTHRCLVPVTSFCEYPDAPPKVPHWFALQSDTEARPLFAFAGIWRHWTGERKKEEGEHTLFAFLTTEPNDVVRPIHSKAMPVILRSEDHETWLNGETENALALAVPYPADHLAVVAKGEKQDAA